MIDKIKQNFPRSKLYYTNGCKSIEYFHYNRLYIFRSSASLIISQLYITPSLKGRSALSAIYQLFVDRFRRSLRVCHLEFDEEAISNGFMAHSISWLGFCGPCGSCFLLLNNI